jgi:hypothetical protein
MSQNFSTPPFLTDSLSSSGTPGSAVTKFLRPTAWRLKNFPAAGMFRVLRPKRLCRELDFRAWKFYAAYQKIKFKQFKASSLRQVLLRKRRLPLTAAKNFLPNRRNAPASKVAQLLGATRRGFSFFWFFKKNLYRGAKLFYFKKRRFSLSQHQEVSRRIRYNAVYKYSRAYSKNFFNYFVGRRVSRLARAMFKKTKKSNILGFGGARVDRVTFYKKKQTAKKVLLTRQLFFSNRRVLPIFNFVLILTATNSNMFAGVSDRSGQLFFYHTLRRVGFQTGGSSKRGSKVAVERLGIFIGKLLRRRQFLNKKFLVVFKGLSWRRRFILKYVRFAAKRKIKFIGIVERTALPHNGCKLKKRKHKRRSFLRLNRIKKKMRIRRVRRVFKERALRPVMFKKTTKILSVLECKRNSRLKFTRVSRYRWLHRHRYLFQKVRAIKKLKLQRFAAENRNFTLRAAG